MHADRNKKTEQIVRERDRDMEPQRQRGPGGEIESMYEYAWYLTTYNTHQRHTLHSISFTPPLRSSHRIEEERRGELYLDQDLQGPR